MLDRMDKDRSFLWRLVRASWETSHHWVEFVAWLAALLGGLLTLLQSKGIVEAAEAEMIGLWIVGGSLLLILVIRIVRAAHDLEAAALDRAIRAEQAHAEAEARLAAIADDFSMPANYHGASTLFWNALKEAYGRWLGSQEGQESGFDDLQGLVEASDWPIRPEDGRLGLNKPNHLLRFCERVVPDQDSRAGILAQHYSLESRFEVEALGPLKRGLVHAAKHIDKTSELDRAVLGRLGVVQYRTLKLVLYFQLALRGTTKPARPPGLDMDLLLRLAARLRDQAGTAMPSTRDTAAPDRPEAEPEYPET